MTGCRHQWLAALLPYRGNDYPSLFCTLRYFSLFHGLGTLDKVTASSRRSASGTKVSFPYHPFGGDSTMASKRLLKHALPGHYRLYEVEQPASLISRRARARGPGFASLVMKRCDLSY